MRLPALLLVAAGSAWASSKPNWNVTLDVAFPGNATYRNETDLPVVFALHNAAVAFQYGYTLDWEIIPADDATASSAKPLAQGSIHEEASKHKPTNASSDNIWYPAASAGNDTRLPAGPYVFSWHWKMRSCREQDVEITIDPNTSVSNGTVAFTLAADGPAVDLTKDCPRYQSQITIEAAEPGNDLMPSCPYINVTTSGLPDPCTAKLSSAAAACVRAGIAGTSDPKKCPSRTDVVVDGQDGGSSSTSSPEPSSTASTKGDEGAAAGVVLPARLGMGAVLSSVMGALLIL